MTCMTVKVKINQYVCKPLLALLLHPDMISAFLYYMYLINPSTYNIVQFQKVTFNIMFEKRKI